MWYSGQSYELRAGRNHWFKEGSIISKLTGGKLAPSFIYSFFGSVNSDVQVPTSLDTEDAAVNEVDKILAWRNLYSRDRKPHSQRQRNKTVMCNTERSDKTFWRLCICFQYKESKFGEQDYFIFYFYCPISPSVAILTVFLSSKTCLL